MKNKIVIVFLVLTIILTTIFCTSCGNMQIIDTSWSFDYAYIDLGNGKIVEGNVGSWKDWGDSDMIQVTMKDGKTYFTHSANVVLIKYK